MFAMRIVGFGKTRFPIGAFALAMAWAGAPVLAADLSEARARTLSNHDLKGTCVWQSVSVRTDRTGSPAEATMIADAEFDGNGTVVLKHARTNFDGIVVD